MIKIWKIILLSAAVLIGTNVSAQEEGWLVRTRLINAKPEVKSSLVDGVEVSSVTTAELDVSYYFNKNLVIEILACCFTRHDVSASGVDLGKAKLAPATVLGQYHFEVNEKFVPYVGVGLNYSVFFDVELNHPLLGPLNLDKTSTGLAFQAGFNVPVSKTSMVNFDVKKIKLGTKVTQASTGALVTDLDLDPLVIGVGYSWRF